MRKVVPRSSLTSNLVDDLVDLFQGQWGLFRRLRHDARYWRGRNALDVQGVSFSPDDKSV